MNLFNYKKFLNKFFSFRNNQILNNTYLIIILWIVLGTSISTMFEFSMNGEVWYWFFSSTAQTFASLIALIVVLYVYRMQVAQSQFTLLVERGFVSQDDNQDIIKKIKEDMLNFKNDAKLLLINTIPIILISLIFLPFGITKGDNMILDIWYTFKLNWVLIFSIIGLCFSSLYKILIFLIDLLE